RRSDEWESILAAIGCLDEVPARIADPAEGSKLSELHQTLVESADARFTYRQLAEQTTHGLFEVARAARDLVTGGILANIDDGARRTGTVRAAILLREARARQKMRDVPGATQALFELAQLYDAQHDRARALEAYEALLRMDRSRKDVQKLLVQRRRTRIGRIV